MEKRIGAAIILIELKDSVDEINSILSAHASIILGRQGLPLRDKGISVINLILEGTTDQISSLTGKLGRLKGVQVKSVLTRYR
jgi:putative iron-only hydrogenase system regulator